MRLFCGIFGCMSSHGVLRRVVSRAATVLAVLLLLTPLGSLSAAERPVDGHGRFGFSVAIPSVVQNAFVAYAATWRRTDEPANVGYSEVGFGAEVGVWWNGIGWLNAEWLPGAVLFSGYQDDLKRLSDPWADVEVEVGADVVGRDALVVDHDQLTVSAGPRAVIPTARPDYAQESADQESGETYIADNQDLHAWALGLHGGAQWREEPEPGERVLVPAAWRVGGGVAWDRFLPMPYDATGLEAYRRNEVRRAVGDAVEAEPFESIDYRSRFAAGVTGGAEWRFGAVTLDGELGLAGSWRRAPRVDDLAPVAGTDVATVHADGGLGVDVALGDRFSLGAELGGRLALVGKNSPAESAVWLSVVTRVGAPFASFSGLD